MRVLVVGAGAMGRWFADSVATADDEVAFVDADETAATAAADALDGRALTPPVEERFDLVCVAVPLPAAASVIEEYADRADRAICDVTGSMRDPIDAMRAHAPEIERVSLHPLFAPENAPGNLAVVTDADGPVGETIRERLRTRGNELVATTPAEHDEAMETVQARAHTAVLAFALAAEDVPETFQTPISEALFDLVEQMTDGEPRVYADIQAAFEGADDVAAAARQIARADAETFSELYESLQ
ncbi:prephenate dehydrogenase/arogenate dehydrogenase family protein [Halomicrobium sp. LC1Hm]|uniref:prephenate dehydrogenase/arogenate dehydrogenase family protein n=1 Tax=Halomicrobium sp. LC1Hm TaxID=2610902 RepID=UPI00129842EC|nr:prephenate dehydrogenase/arogenate dehydrogenase family protein [Halomicrobium sp. LC1Hm]QGA82509.1 Prephenate dehydrogenase [Halomicrobium sp. LC1Hm]